MSNKEKKKKRNYFRAIIYCLFPFFQGNKTNRKIKNKIKSIGDELAFDDEGSVLSCFNHPELIDISTLDKMIEDNRHRMERLEDKAKVQIAGITIAISIIFGVAGNLKNIAHDVMALKWAVYGLLLACVIYMFLAGIQAYHLLTNRNVFYYLPSNVQEKNADEKIKIYNARIVKNQLQNTIRNNEIFMSYAYMRNAMVLLIIVFALWIVPIL